jgi:hypothetical protein
MHYSLISTVSDALELLSKSFTSHTVRDYAVSRLEKASDEVLKLTIGIYIPGIVVILTTTGSSTSL